jgi:hypothetical protein
VQSVALMTTNETPRSSNRPERWLSWLTLVAGAVMCAVAVLLS